MIIARQEKKVRNSKVMTIIYHTRTLQLTVTFLYSTRQYHRQLLSNTIANLLRT